MFGFPLEGVRHTEATDFNADSAWEAFTGIHRAKDYDPRKSKSSQIKSPALRYIHRFLAHSIFGRGESTGVVRRDELFFLWAMSQHIQINTAVWMCNQFLHVKGGTGKICLGGLVTVIADFYGYEPTIDFTSRIWGNEKIDLDTLVAMGMCKKVSGYYQLVEDGVVIPRHRAEAGTSSQAAPSTSPARATAAAAAAPAPTATASASHPTQTAGPVTMEMLMAKMNQMEMAATRFETDVRDSFGRLFSRVDDIEKKIDEWE